MSIETYEEYIIYCEILEILCQLHVFSIVGNNKVLQFFSKVWMSHSNLDSVPQNLMHKN